MVKSKDDYKKRMDDSRFAKFDALINPQTNEKPFYIALIGVIVVLLLMTAPPLYYSWSSPVNQTKEIKYEQGLNISYEPQGKYYNVDFTNPKNDTLKAIIKIQVPYDINSVTNPYLDVYNYETTEFPLNKNYTPSQQTSKDLHTVIVKLIKSDGEYTYKYSATPETENQMWEGTGKYINYVKNIFSIP